MNIHEEVNLWLSYIMVLVVVDKACSHFTIAGNGHKSADRAHMYVGV